jgi:hypothetical protein
VKASSSAGAWVTYRFTGRAVALVTTRAATRGQVKVYVDNVYAATVDLRSTTTQYRAVAWTRRWTASAIHTVKFVVVGTKGRPRVDLDAIALIR